MSLKRKTEILVTDRVVRKQSRWNDFPTPIKMRLQYFPAIIVMQRIGKLLEFNEQTMHRLHRRCYNQPDTAFRMFEQFKKYLAEMDRRTTQRIPKEQLVEYFGGEHPADKIIKGMNYLTKNIAS